MEHQKMVMIIALMLVTLFSTGATAQSTDCTNVLISMSPCLNYISGNSSTPSTGCCTQLASVVRSQPQCLCQVLNGGGSSLGLNINQTQAMALPKACNVQTPPVSRCNAAGSPAASPDASPNSPNTEPSDGGSKTVPSTGDGSSDATSTKLGASLLFFLLFIASYVTSFTVST
ncbi:Bifunctional inhibitor/lipid-transfer protein/seed storage 2S albumin superfamily protein [Forsythia ovata]|uniref:Bifunctional inhibitor/lipid-transfer protein/seed storage 2S albumin superfamily protein n=1 Tax=Forsythia ovata TaxID=205694 RepID=A0ABD1UZY0_9LAMI